MSFKCHYSSYILPILFLLSFYLSTLKPIPSLLPYHGQKWLLFSPFLRCVLIPTNVCAVQTAARVQTSWQTSTKTKKWRQKQTSVRLLMDEGFFHSLKTRQKEREREMARQEEITFSLLLLFPAWRVLRMLPSLAMCVYGCLMGIRGMRANKKGEEKARMFGDGRNLAPHIPHYYASIRTFSWSFYRLSMFILSCRYYSCTFLQLKNSCNNCRDELNTTRGLKIFPVLPVVLVRVWSM